MLLSADVKITGFHSPWLGIAEPVAGTIRMRGRLELVRLSAIPGFGSSLHRACDLTRGGKSHLRKPASRILLV
jgi:hypothetical protein